MMNGAIYKATGAKCVGRRSIWRRLIRGYPMSLPFCIIKKPMIASLSRILAVPTDECVFLFFYSLAARGSLLCPLPPPPFLLFCQGSRITLLRSRCSKLYIKAPVRLQSSEIHGSLCCSVFPSGRAFLPSFCSTSFGAKPSESV